MAQSAKEKKAKEVERLLKIRDLEPADGMELLGILSAAGANPAVGHNIGLAITANNDKNTAVAMQAGGAAIIQALHAALGSPQNTERAENFLFSVWNPPLGPIAGDTDEARETDELDKKRAALKKLGFKGYFLIADAFRRSEDFNDFLEWLPSVMPNLPATGDTPTPSEETTG